MAVNVPHTHLPAETSEVIAQLLELVETLQTDIAALEAAQVVRESGTYTPTLGNMVVGTAGTNTATYTYVGDDTGGHLAIHGRILFGSAGQTFPGASSETVSLPTGFQIASDFADGLNVLGGICVIDADSTDFTGHLRWSSNTTLRLVLEQDGAGVGANNIAIVDFTSGDPIATWAQGDGFDWHAWFPAVKV